MIPARKLEPSAFPETDPVLAAFRNAPVSDEPETEETRAAFEAGMADLRAGRVRTVSHQEIQATIERMRRDRANDTQGAGIVMRSSIHGVRAAPSAPADRKNFTRRHPWGILRA